MDQGAPQGGGGEPEPGAQSGLSGRRRAEALDAMGEVGLGASCLGGLDDATSGRGPPAAHGHFGLDPIPRRPARGRQKPISSK